MAKFLAVLHMSYGPGEFGWANVECTVPGFNPTTANVKEVEAHAVRTNGASSAVLTQMIPLDSE